MTLLLFFHIVAARGVVSHCSTMNVFGSALVFLLTGKEVASFSQITAPPVIPSVLDIPPPSDLPSSVATDLANDGVAVIPNYACSDTVNLLRFDALRLQHAGLVKSAGTKGDSDVNKAKTKTLANADGKNTNSSNTNSSRPLRRAKHFWLIDRKLESGRPYLGPSYISDLVSTLEEEVDGTSPFSHESENDDDSLSSNSIQNLLARREENSVEDSFDDVHTIHNQETEAAYLYYEKGGYYDWHFDTPSDRAATATAAAATIKTKVDANTKDKKTHHRRAFSFLLYLGGHEPDPDTGIVPPWDADKDGGELRVFPSISLDDQHRRINGVPKKTNGNVDANSLPGGRNRGLVGDPTGRTDFRDIVPQEGTLVIFKSEAICHQVLATNRERLVVVGWIHGNLK